METRRFSIPPFYYFWILFALTLSLGAIWHREIAGSLLLSFPLLLLGAALPTLGVMAHGALRLGSPLKWQHIALALFIGSTVSIIAALILEFILPFLAYLLIAPLRPMLLDFGEIGFGTPGFIKLVLFIYFKRIIDSKFFDICTESNWTITIIMFTECIVIISYDLVIKCIKIFLNYNFLFHLQFIIGSSEPTCDTFN